MRDVFFLICDGLKGLPEVVENVWPQARVQTCIIHLIRNSFRLVSRKYSDALKRDLKLIYTAPNADAAAAALDTLDEKWGDKHAAMVRLWRNSWTEFTPFLGYDVNIRNTVLRTDPCQYQKNNCIFVDDECGTLGMYVCNGLCV